MGNYNILNKIGNTPLIKLKQASEIKNCNIYGKDIILIVDPISGLVTGRINVENIFNRKNYNDKIDVMNGIAYNKINNSIIITGKWWPSMYEIKILN